MRQRWVKFDLSIAIVLSVLIHVGLIWWMLRSQIEALARLLASGMANNEWLDAKKHPADDEDLGEAHGAGTAIAASPGDDPAAGMEADIDQPFLSRDPAGMGKVGEKPSPYTGPTGGGAPASAMQQSAAAAAQQSLEMPSPDPIEPPPTFKPPVKPSDDATKSANRPPEKEPTPVAKTAVASATNPPLKPDVKPVDDSVKPATPPDLKSNPASPPTAPPARPSKSEKDDAPSDKPPTNPKPTMAGVPDHPLTDVDKSTVKATAPKSPDDPNAVAAAPPAPSQPDPAKAAPPALDPKAVAIAVPPPAPPDTDNSADKSPYQTAMPPGATPPDAPAPAPSPAAAARKASAASAVPPAQTPGLPMQSADPAPQADSEIDPFAKIPSAEFRAGKTTVRSGRKAKLTRPKIPLVGFWDGVALGRAAVTLHLVLDKTGQVVQADVIQSSGSTEIDNPICQEAYNWWFEPNKDADGQPIKTEFPFTVCVFR